MAPSDGPTEPPEPRFTLPYDIVRRCALAFERGFLPVAGGVLDQPAILWDEIHLWLALYGYHMDVQRELHRIERENERGTHGY